MNHPRSTVRLLTLLLCWASFARVQAQWLTQSFSLAPGWNAVYLNVDASYDSITDLVGSDPTNPIQEIWLWQPAPTTTQFLSDPQKPLAGNSQWSTWIRNGASTLHNLVANQAYLVFVPAPTNYIWSLKGTPKAPQYVWTSSGLNFIGFPAVTNPPPFFNDYLAPAPGLAAALTANPNGGLFYYPGGDLGPNNPAQVFALAAQPVGRGQAYWIRSGGFNSYFGPFNAVISGSSSLNFGQSLGQYSFRLQNRTANPLNVTLQVIDSESPPPAQPPIVATPPLLIRGAINLTNHTYGFTALNGGSYTVSLLPQGQPGSDVEVVVGLNRSAMSNQPGDLLAGILRLTDDQGLSQIDLPVSAQMDSNSGLWVGQASVNTVNQYLNSYYTVRDGAGLTNLLNTLLNPDDPAYQFSVVWQASVTNPPAGAVTTVVTNNQFLPPFVVPTPDNIPGQITPWVSIQTNAPTNFLWIAQSTSSVPVVSADVYATNDVSVGGPPDHVLDQITDWAQFGNSGSSVIWSATQWSDALPTFTTVTTNNNLALDGSAPPPDRILRQIADWISTGTNGNTVNWSCTKFNYSPPATLNVLITNQFGSDSSGPIPPQRPEIELNQVTSWVGYTNYPNVYWSAQFSSVTFSNAVSSTSISPGQTPLAPSHLLEQVTEWSLVTDPGPSDTVALWQALVRVDSTLPIGLIEAQNTLPGDGTPLPPLRLLAQSAPWSLLTPYGGDTVFWQAQVSNTPTGLPIPTLVYVTNSYLDPIYATGLNVSPGTPVVPASVLNQASPWIALRTNAPSVSYVLDTNTSRIIRLTATNGVYLAKQTVTAPAGVSRSFPLRLILDHETNGTTTLLQRVYVGPDVASNQIVSVRQDRLDPNRLASARRISSTVFPFQDDAHNLGYPSQALFQQGSSLSFAVNLDYNDQRSNPFVHTYHPDHDNLSADYSQRLGPGVESFSINRQITLYLNPPPGDFDSLTAASSVMTGAYSETITVQGDPSLNQARINTVAGSFKINRITSTPVLTR